MAEALVAAGYDVVRSIHVLGAAAPDEEVLAYALEDDRYLVTCDRDFGKLVFQDRKEPPPGIIYIRFEPQDVEEIVPRVLAVLKSPDLSGNLVVIGDGGDRLTELPR
jgi:predicted nuclease of predicted toxin-antitoxin system